jgi:CBS-domain-containing membrane protein
MPALFPSLRPTAYLLAVASGDEESRPRRVIGGHAIGAVAGLLAYHVLAAGLVATASPAALSPVGARLAAAGVVSVALTTAGMLATDLRHAPACATTLIVSLGLLPTLSEGVLIVVSVVLLVAVRVLLGRVTWLATDRLG